MNVTVTTAVDCGAVEDAPVEVLPVFVEVTELSSHNVRCVR